MNVESREFLPKLLFLDLEVANVPTQKGEPSQCITQIVVHDPDREKSNRTFEAFIKPSRLIINKKEEPNFSHGNSEVPKYKFKKAWPYLRDWVNEGLNGKRVAIFVMHNGYKHDWPILKEACARINEAIPQHWKPFCTAYLAGALHIPGERTLTGLCHTLNVKVRPAHNAYNDVKMLKGVFNKIVGDTDRTELFKGMLDKEHPIKSVASLIKTNKTAMLVFFDFESTGLFPKKGCGGENPRVVELAGYIPQLDQSFSTLVNPECPIPAEAQAVHHISDQDVADAPDFKTAWTAFESWIKGHLGSINQEICWAGHNIWGYDLPLYKAESERVGLPKLNGKSFDTLYLSRHIFKGVKVSHKLQHLRELFNIPEDEAHRAAGDVRVNWLVFKKFTEGLNEKQISTALLSAHPILSLGALIRDNGTFNPQDVPLIAPSIQMLPIAEELQKEPRNEQEVEIKLNLKRKMPSSFFHKREKEANDLNREPEGEKEWVPTPEKTGLQLKSSYEKPSVSPFSFIRPLKKQKSSFSDKDK